jgi:signal transduction histidine kinase
MRKMIEKCLLWLASFRLRIFFRTAFLLLTLSVMALAVTVLQGEKQRSYKNYQNGLTKTKEQIVARLRHPSGQLALLNPPGPSGVSRNLHPVLLPFSAIDFDDQNKVRHAMEMADCLIRYENNGSLCVAIGNNPWMGGFIYAAGTFSSGPLVAHEIGNPYLDGAHRMRVAVYLRGHRYRWLAPFEILPVRRDATREGVRGRFTGYVELEGRDYLAQMPVKEFRGWVWQEAQCADKTQNAEDCARTSFFSLRLPVEVLIADLLRSKKAPWPPADLDDIHVRIEVLPPGEGTPLFDSAASNATPLFSLNDLGALLQPGERLRIRKKEATNDLIQIKGREETGEPISPLLIRLIRRLPVDARNEAEDAAVDLEDTVATPVGVYSIFLSGEAERVVNQTLSATATRLSWFVLAVMAAIVLAWLIIEIGIVRRVARLSQRARQLSLSAGQSAAFLAFEPITDLKGNDELGILVRCLNQLLRRVREDAGREKIRAEQEKEQWHAVGHEIMSPLQSLLALHSNPEDPSHRYIARMQQAVRVLYGHASPSEAFQSSMLEVAPLDINAFLAHVAANAPHIGIENVVYTPQTKPVLVHADEYSFEDVVSHLLKNADRHRAPGTPIMLELAFLPETDAGTVTIIVRNRGPQIAPEWLEKIFAYGFSNPEEAPTEGSRGQGLFVAKTYMAKMGGTIRVHNETDGVSFYLCLQRARKS